MEDDYYHESAEDYYNQPSYYDESAEDGAARADAEVSAWRDAVKHVPLSEMEEILAGTKKKKSSLNQQGGSSKRSVQPISKRSEVKVGPPPIRDELAAKLLQEEETQTSLQQQVKDLTSTLTNEMAAPDLLPYRHFALLQDKVREQMDEVLDEEKSEKYSPLERALLEMEANRYEFELVSYNRTRLQKISQFPTFFLNEQADRMSAEERDFARNYEQLYRDHFYEAFLSKLPADFADLKDENDRELYPKPDLKSVVVFNAKTKLGQIFPGEEAILAGQTFAGPYNLVEEALKNDSIALV